MIVLVNPIVANIALVMMVWSIPSAAQSMSNDDFNLMKTRWESIAESVIVKIPSTVSGRIMLIVETETDQSIIENSFLAAFGRKGIEVTFGKEQSPGEMPILRISGIVSQMTPTVQTSCDARWEHSDGTVRFLGRFHSENTPRSPEDGAPGETVLERIFEPLVVIAGAVMIVYLFFAVRS